MKRCTVLSITLALLLMLLAACGDGDPEHDISPPFGPPTAAIPAAPSASQSL